MNGDIEIVRTKQFDGRVWQPKPKWCIEAGALSLSNAQFASLSSTAGQCTFQVQVPSTSVYMDRLVNWQSTVGIQMNVTPAQAILAQTLANPQLGVIVTPGLDFSLCPSPIHSLVTSLQAAIGDTQVTNNLAQTRELMALLADTPANRKDRTQPCYLDTYQSYLDSFGTTNNPLSGFERASTSATEENGAWPIAFCAPVANGVGVATYYVNAAGAVSLNAAQFAGQQYDTVTIAPGGVPKLTATTNVLGVGVAPFYPVGFQFTSIEPLQLSPFIWQEVHERQTGLSQLQNISIIANMQTPQAARLIRWTARAGKYISSIQYLANTTGTPFSAASIQGQFLTPPIELMPIPPINTVDYQQVVSYVYPAGGFAGTAPTVVSQTLSLPVIPDYLIVAVVPQSGYYSGSNGWPWATCEGTFYLPIQNVSVTWSNMSGLLSSLSQSQLFNIAKANGLDMSYQQWRGYAQTAQERPPLPGINTVPAGGLDYTQVPLAYKSPGYVQTTGGPLILRPGKDITLETGQASGMSAGQWTVQFSLQLDLSAFSPQQITALAGAQGCSVVVLAVNGGFFATKAGSSRVVIGPVPAGTVANASVSNQDEIATGDRLVGAGRQKRSRPLLAEHVARRAC